MDSGRNTAHQIQATVRRGRRLEFFTIGWNCLEGVVSVIAGLLSGSISLVGFGFDSFIEVTSGAALLWRLGHEADAQRRARAERASLRMVGTCFAALAIYIAWNSASALIRRAPPETSIPGILIAIASLIVMPLLARAKRKVAHSLNSAAMRADSRQSDFCMWLSAILLAGLLLNALFGWWWADPAAALAMTPFIAREAIEGLRGHACCACSSDPCHRK